MGEVQLDELRQAITAAEIPGVAGVGDHTTHVGVYFRVGGAWVIWARGNRRGEVTWAIEGHNAPVSPVASGVRVVELIREEAAERA
ncbi:hypothetical protein [Flindersiella endophytica]